MNNQRNNNGVKDCSNTYLKGGKYQQWTDFGGETLTEVKENIKNYKKDFPQYDFIAKKQSYGGYRIYYCEVNKSAVELGSLGGKSTSKKYGKKHFSEAGKKGMKVRWGK